ncbi:hypothetical protein [Rhizobacter sp. SG703]|nr:hypothetical protein [Rhizobacter sp. SG703]NKI97560.1 hypothetical protein [Rhizobacter sp. SG703]
MSRRYIARYTLSDGTRGALQVVAAHSFDVIDLLVHRFATLRCCSARCL